MITLPSSVDETIERNRWPLLYTVCSEKTHVPEIIVTIIVSFFFARLQNTEERNLVWPFSRSPYMFLDYYCPKTSALFLSQYSSVKCANVKQRYASVSRTFPIIVNSLKFYLVYSAKSTRPCMCIAYWINVKNKK